MVDKLIEFQRKLQEEKFDAFFVTNTMNSYYFSKFLSHSYAFLLVYPELTPKLYVPELDYEDARHTVKNCEVVKIDRNSEVLQLIKQNLEENQVNNLGIEDNSMSVKFYLDITEKYNFLKLDKGSQLIDELRITKTAEEIEKLKKACRIADKGVAIAEENIAVNRRELEIAAEVEYFMRKEGSETVPFDTIIASGYRSAFPHGVSSNKKIQQGDLIIIDIGAKIDGYCSDITRTVVIGPPNPKQQIYNSVLKAQQIAIKTCEIGKNANVVEEEARKILSETGYNEFFVHSLGHGVGLEVHELPTIALKSKDILQENSVFTIEPGVYLPNFGGVRIEDDILLTKKGAKTLTNAEYTFEI
jgi:Xaa-Pro dipeptidase